MDDSGGVITSFFGDLTDTLVAFCLTVINLLPESPFRSLIYSFQGSAIYGYLQYVNYILPIGEMISVLSLWLAGVGIYYVYQLVLRWIRVIE